MAEKELSMFFQLCVWWRTGTRWLHLSGLENSTIYLPLEKFYKICSSGKMKFIQVFLFLFLRHVYYRSISVLFNLFLVTRVTQVTFMYCRWSSTIVVCRSHVIKSRWASTVNNILKLFLENYDVSCYHFWFKSFLGKRIQIMKFIQCTILHWGSFVGPKMQKRPIFLNSSYLFPPMWK